jgi:signal transduction histidine kinase
MIFNNIVTSSTWYIVIVATIVIFFFIMFFYLLVIQIRRRRALYEKEMAELKVQYEQAILTSQIEIQEQMFRNISQEIHDNIGQVLSLAKLNLNTIPAHVSEQVALSEELLGKAITDLRDLSKSMHPEKIADIGLVNAIQQELNLVQRAAKIQTVLDCDDDDILLTNEKCIIVFRMIQESLNNIVKHAKAKFIEVVIATTADKTLITIKDDGVGFDIEKLNNLESGIGLKSIQQRCKLINASFHINSVFGEGTNIQLTILNT